MYLSYALTKRISLPSQVFLLIVILTGLGESLTLEVTTDHWLVKFVVLHRSTVCCNSHIFPVAVLDACRKDAVSVLFYNMLVY